MPSASFEIGTNEAWLVNCPVEDLTLTLACTTGTDPLHDTIRNRIGLPPVEVACDAVTELPVVVAPGGGGSGDPYGRIVGRIDVLAIGEITTPLGTDLDSARSRVRGLGPLENLHGGAKNPVVADWPP